MRDLTFTYEDAEGNHRHLDKVNIELRRGQAIALVGASGGGKSTLLNLLRGLDRPAHVNVLRDGQPAAGGLSYLSQATTLMPQDPEIFGDTVRFNIAFGMEASDAELHEAIRLARFDTVIERLPKGLDTNIAEKGINLSGGEKQRLALARGIFFAKDSGLILLDEPTSSVDAVNEQIIYRNLIQHFRSSCLVSSIHRLHLLELFDMIYLIDRGRIVESGDFKTLVERNGAFAAMWRSYVISEPRVDILLPSFSIGSSPSISFL